MNHFRELPKGAKPEIKRNPAIESVIGRFGYKVNALAGEVARLESEVARLEGELSTAQKRDAFTDADKSPENVAWVHTECERLQVENAELRARLGSSAPAPKITTSENHKPTQEVTGRARFVSSFKIK